MKFFSENVHKNVYFFGLILLAISIPTSLFMMSVAQFLLIINWLVEGRVREKALNFFRNKPALIFSLIFLVHIIGIFYTTDFSYALKDIKTKIPLLLLPLIVVSSGRLKDNQLNQILYFFIATVTVSTFISTYLFLFKDFNDIRQISPFISHIRFSLMICLSISLLVYYFFKKQLLFIRISLIFIIAWLVFFLFLFESATGISILLILLLFYLCFFTIKAKNIYARLIYLLTFLFISFYIYHYINRIYVDYNRVQEVNFSSLEPLSPHGNVYYHDTTTLQRENGNLVWIYICDEELEESWAQKSNYSIRGKDDKGQELIATLIRYMSSKGLKKDADGFRQLEDYEIRAVEKGISSVNFFEKVTIKKRIREILYEYETYTKTGDANGLSVIMRYEFVKAGLGIIKENIIFGVGTGDVRKAFETYYIETNSLLEPHFRWRTHNQFLSFFVTFGIIGLLIFLTALIYPPYKMRKFNYYPFLSFFIICFLSMLTEDTIETQAGVTFFAFFNTILLFGSGSNENENI
ncbi:MAG: O-antigen ligase family protein [Bacteroidales bacterium]|nr:O-antigen ligase family protein [Bacteroidales bacterium]